MFDSNALIGKKLKERYIPKEIEGNGIDGITYSGIDFDLNAPVAIKVLFCPNLDESWKEEVRKAASLRTAHSSHIVQVHDYGEYVVTKENTEEKYPFIVSEFIDGITLEDFLSKNRNNISQEFILQFINDICEAIAAMRFKELEHGDLHEGNIMLENPKPYLENSKFVFKIIDFGRSRSILGSRYSDDMERFTKILKKFWAINQQYDGEFIQNDKETLRWLPMLLKKLEDPETNLKTFGPKEVVEYVNRIKEENIHKEKMLGDPLTQPFEFLDVIEIPEDNSLLNDLFVPMPWYDELNSFGNTLISGPRGSGKSMILRYMQFKTKLRNKEYLSTGLMTERFIGFYLHCHPSIYLPFSAQQIVFDVNASDMILHYINLQLAFEIIDTLIISEKLNAFFIGDDVKKNVFDYISEVLQEPAILLTGIDPLSYSKELLNRELRLIQIKIINSFSSKKRTNVGFLYDFCKLLREKIPYFSDKRFFFLIDDYSYPNVSYKIQNSFNRVVRFKNSIMCFKISTEKFSIDFNDFEGKTLQQNHEYHYIDLGSKYLTKSKEKIIRYFMENVLNKRFEQAGIKKTVKEIFNEYRPPGKRIGPSLANPETRDSTLYAGFYIISMLCSGDLRTFLELCKEIFRQANFDRKNPKSIDFKIQDKAIRQFSRTYLAEVRSYPDGEQLLEIATAFGDISRKYLYQYGPITKSQDRFQEMIRIEIEGVSPLNSELARNLYEKLIRYSIFIDGGEGYPRRDEITTRLIFRRIYAPAFQISYNNRECLRLNPEDFEDFLLSPNSFNLSEFLKDPVGFREKRERQRNEEKTKRTLDDFRTESG